VTSPNGFWSDGADSHEPRRIEDYALIGDCETAALVSRSGSIDWLCWPRFDSEAAMAALLGTAENGFWRIAPAGRVGRIERRYRGDTLILETEFETEDGRVRLTDLMPIRGSASDIVRIVEGLSGRVAMRSVVNVQFEYGRLRPLLRRVEDREVSALAGPHAVVLRAEHRLHADGGIISSDFEVSAGDRTAFVLTYFPSHCDEPDAVDAAAALRATERFWSDWASACTYEGPYREAVIRSLITLKALTYRPTGGTVAAPSSSLPETPGGVRNWDYRYCWLRDAAFMLLAFVHGGYRDEAEAWRDWLIRALAGEPSDVRPLYAVDGARGIHEFEAPWLCGFNDAQPVRFGNAAHQQTQIDVFGEVIDALHLARREGVDANGPSRELQMSMLATLEKRWKEPDAGFWEIRSQPRHFVHSKALAWAAFDRAVRGFRQDADRETVERWSRLRDEIRREIMEKGCDRERNCFVQSFGSSELDAATLMLSLTGFVPPEHPMALGTVAAIEQELMPDGLVLRYRPEAFDDGLPGSEGAFLACSFWMVDNYHLQGRSDDAHALFEKLVGLSNDVGLLSEEYSSSECRLLGNFPQALTHVGLLNSAYNLSEAKGPAEERLAMHR
jgi:GH15 family glucan-1,4-alpha-glucosidase